MKISKASLGFVYKQIWNSVTNILFGEGNMRANWRAWHRAIADMFEDVVFPMVAAVFLVVILITLPVSGLIFWLVNKGLVAYYGEYKPKTKKELIKKRFPKIKQG